MLLHKVKFRAMGSPCSIRVYAPDLATAKAWVQPAVDEVLRLEQVYSRYRQDSLVSRINASAGGDAVVLEDEEACGLIDYAFSAWEQSEGLFDITSGVLRKAWDFKSGVLPSQTAVQELLPLVGMDKLSWRRPALALPLPGMELDFGGYVKEYAADAAAGVCRAQGLTSGMVELGGDIAVIGPQAGGQPWPLGITDPTDPKSALMRIGMEAGALASSGDYERCMWVKDRRYSHILNPLTGWPAMPPAQVSVVAESCLVAGTVSTIAMLKGDEGCLEWLASVGLPYCVVRHTGEVINTL